MWWSGRKPEHLERKVCEERIRERIKKEERGSLASPSFGENWTFATPSTAIWGGREENQNTWRGRYVKRE
jgi:hypothetical protein